jgi:hypothetical protein
MLALLIEFLVELLRAFLVDELSGHIRRRVRRSWLVRRSRRTPNILWRVHCRNRDRLLHRLLTEGDEEV